MENLHASFGVHWDDEPTLSASQKGSATGWPVPLLGGVRGGFVRARFMESPLSTFFRMHRDHEPTPSPSQEGSRTAWSPPGRGQGWVCSRRFMERIERETFKDFLLIFVRSGSLSSWYQ